MLNLFVIPEIAGAPWWVTVVLFVVTMWLIPGLKWSISRYTGSHERKMSTIDMLGKRVEEAAIALSETRIKIAELEGQFAECKEKLDRLINNNK